MPARQCSPGKCPPGLSSLWYDTFMNDWSKNKIITPENQAAARTVLDEVRRTYLVHEKARCEHREAQRKLDFMLDALHEYAAPGSRNV